MLDQKFKKEHGDIESKLAWLLIGYNVNLPSSSGKFLRISSAGKSGKNNTLFVIFVFFDHGKQGVFTSQRQRRDQKTVEQVVFE